MLLCGLLNLTGRPGRLYPGPIMIRQIALATLFAPALFAKEQYIDWQTNYHQAQAEAKAAKKPIFLEFRCEA